MDELTRVERLYGSVAEYNRCMEEEDSDIGYERGYEPSECLPDWPVACTGCWYKDHPYGEGDEYDESPCNFCTRCGADKWESQAKDMYYDPNIKVPFAKAVASKVKGMLIHIYWTVRTFPGDIIMRRSIRKHLNKSRRTI